MFPFAPSFWIPRGVAAGGGAGNGSDYSFTKLLMGFSTPGGAQSMADESPVARTGIAGNANAANNTSNTCRFGPFGGLWTDTENIRWPDSDDWNFGTGPFTVDLWLASLSPAGDRAFVSQATQFTTNVATNSWILGTVGGNVAFKFYDQNLGDYRTITGTAAIPFNSFRHIAVDRGADNIIRVYFGGVMIGSFSYSGEIRQVSEVLTINGVPGSNNKSFAYYDEIRIIKGKAAWASNAGFAPPATPYARA